MPRIVRLSIFVAIAVFLSACTLGAEKRVSPSPAVVDDAEETPSAAESVPSPSPAAMPGGAPSPSPAAAPGGAQPLPSGTSQRIQPEDLEYLGAFRLPQASGGSSWEYSGQGLTFNPRGDPGGPDDGFPGSLFGFGHDQEMLVSEISIPEPVRAASVEGLNTAETLQPFGDVSGGLFDPRAVDLPRGGLAYLDTPEGPKLHFTFGWHFQEFGDASHGWSSLDLSDPRPAGLWVFDGYTNYVTDDYLFAIPPAWAETYAPGFLLAGGRAREGPWSGRGPALFAYTPWADGAPLPPGGTLRSVKPLLLYGRQPPGEVEIVSDETMQMQNYADADHWWGGAWLTAGDKSAVAFVGTKAVGASWYGFANGLVWDYECAEHTPPTCPEVPEWPYDDRGYWAEGYQAQIIFYDPADLGAVARGEMQPWEPQPYAVLALDEYLFDPQVRVEDYKRDLVGAAAFDREHGLLYIIERLADEYKSVVHVFRLRP